MKRIVNSVCVVLAFVCVGIGCIGIILPFLPTTPFFLVALALFAKGSERFHRWFMSTGLYKKYLQDFVATRSMTRSAKRRVLGLVTALLTVGFIFSPWMAKIVIVLVLVFHYVYFIFGIRTIDDEEQRAGKEKR